MKSTNFEEIISPSDVLGAEMNEFQEDQALRLIHALNVKEAIAIAMTKVNPRKNQN